MVEYLLKNAPAPSDQGVCYDWMEIRADNVKTRTIQMISDNGLIPRAFGLPGSRTMMLRLNPPVASTMPCILPAGEQEIFYPMLQDNIPGDIITEWFSSNDERLEFLPGTGGHGNLSFVFHQPPKWIGGLINITLTFSISSLVQSSASLPNGQQVSFNVQLFQATLPDFSNEVLVPSILCLDNMMIAVSNTGSTATNRQVLNFSTITPENDTLTQQDYYIRFKIARGQTTTDNSTLAFLSATLKADLFDFQ